MKLKWIGVLLFVSAFLATAGSDAQTPPLSERKPVTKAPATVNAQSGPMEAVRASAQAFAEAFNKHDAKAVAAHWTEDGEYVDEAGQRFEGRAAIEQLYSEFFAAHPSAKLTVVVDAVRPAGDSAAIEDGHTELMMGGESAVSSARYTAVHAKSGDRWLMSSVRDERLESAPSVHQLQDLAWLVGVWKTEQNGGQMQVDCQWIADGRYLKREYSVKRGDHVVASGLQVIGWHAQTQTVASWTFTSDGGHAIGSWTPHRGGWIIENAGMLADGTPTGAVNYFVRIDDDTLSWKSLDRSVGGSMLPESAEVVLKRVAAKP